MFANKIKLSQVREGSVVMVRGCFGNDPAVRATVTGVDSDIKNGLPGIDYRTREGDMHWAYLDQVDSVVKF